MPEIKAPLVATIQITGHCNLDCLYCFSFPCPRIDMSKHSVHRIIDEFFKAEVFRIELSGGEPFLHPDILEFIEHLAENPIGLACAISSNGIPFTDRNLARNVAKVIRRLQKEDDGIVPLQISLDSPMPEINDKVRGKTKDVITGIRNLLEENVPICLAVVIHAQNIRTADNIIDFFYPQIKNFHFMNIMPSIKSAKNGTNSWLKPNQHDISSFWQYLEKRISIDFPEARISSPMDEIGILKKRSLLTESISCHRCTAGFTRIAVTPDLKVIPCVLSRNIIMGDLSSHSFNEIWNSTTAEHIRSLRQNPCQISIESFMENKQTAAIM